MSEFDRSLAGTRIPFRTKKLSIMIILFPASFLGMAWNGRSFHEKMLMYQIASPYPRSSVSRRRGREFWERTEESGCFHMDSVCNWNDGWFYGPNRDEDAAHQPTAMLLGTLAEDRDILHWNDPYFYGPDERIQVISQQVMTQQRPKRKAFYLQEDDNLSNKFFNS